MIGQTVTRGLVQRNLVDVDERFRTIVRCLALSIILHSNVHGVELCSASSLSIEERRLIFPVPSAADHCPPELVNRFEEAALFETRLSQE